MTVQEWSDQIVVAEFADDPQFTDEMTSLAEKLVSKPADVVVNLVAVTFLNSSNIARLLRLRKQVLAAQRRLILCGVNSQVLGVFQVTGLENIFQFTSDVATALATLQLSETSES